MSIFSIVIVYLTQHNVLEPVIFQNVYFVICSVMMEEVILVM